MGLLHWQRSHPVCAHPYLRGLQPHAFARIMCLQQVLFNVEILLERAAIITPLCRTLASFLLCFALSGCRRRAPTAVALRALARSAHQFYKPITFHTRLRVAFYTVCPVDDDGVNRNSSAHPADINAAAPDSESFSIKDAAVMHAKCCKGVYISHGGFLIEHGARNAETGVTYILRENAKRMK